MKGCKVLGLEKQGEDEGKSLDSRFGHWAERVRLMEQKIEESRAARLFDNRKQKAKLKGDKWEGRDQLKWKGE